MKGHLLSTLYIHFPPYLKKVYYGSYIGKNPYFKLSIVDHISLGIDEFVISEYVKCHKLYSTAVEVRV